MPPNIPQAPTLIQNVEQVLSIDEIFTRRTSPPPMDWCITDRILVARKLLGHGCIEGTLRYSHLSPDVKT